MIDSAPPVTSSSARQLLSSSKVDQPTLNRPANPALTGRDASHNPSSRLVITPLSRKSQAVLRGRSDGRQRTPKGPVSSRNFSDPGLLRARGCPPRGIGFGGRCPRRLRERVQGARAGERGAPCGGPCRASALLLSGTKRVLSWNLGGFSLAHRRCAPDGCMSVKDASDYC
jgi:hypothetical protein